MKTIMKKIIILIGWILVASVVSAQSWSLDDCMRYAAEHATDVKRETINARQRKQDYHHAVAAFLPTVAGGVHLTSSLKKSVFYNLLINNILNLWVT